MGITALTKGDRWAIDHEGKIFHGAEIDERVSKLEEIEKNREQKRTEELEKKRKKRIYDYVKKIWGSQDPQIYYPLKEGMTWEYQQYQRTSDTIFGPGETSKVVVTNFAPRELKGKKVTPQKMDAEEQSYFSFIVEDGDGIYEFATQPPTVGEPGMKASPVYFIKCPIQVGTTWENRTQTSLVGKLSVTLKSTIESIDEVVTDN